MRYATLEMKKINGIAGDSHQPSETGEPSYIGNMQCEIKLINHNLLLWCQGLGCTFVEQSRGATLSEFSFCIWLVLRWHLPAQCTSDTFREKLCREKQKCIHLLQAFLMLIMLRAQSHSVWIKFINQSEMSDVFRMRGDSGYLFLHDHSRIHSDRKIHQDRKTLDVFHSKYYWKKTWG